MAPKNHPPRKIRQKQYILASLAGILAATAVVIIVSIILRPAYISFSVTDARSGAAGASSYHGVYLNLTLVADNPSGHADVEYETLDVMYWYSTMDWIVPNTSVDLSSATLLQPPRNATAIGVTALTLDGVWYQEYIGNRSRTPFNVLVAAQVRFRVGLVYTMPYNVKVSCTPVEFLTKTTNETFTPVQCSG